MSQESDWMLDALVSAAAGHPVGMSNRSANDNQEDNDRKADDGVNRSDDVQPPSLSQRLRRLFAVFRPTAER